MSRGYFEIGILRGKTVENIGTLWRSAYQLGAAGIFTIGRRYARQASDTLATAKHIPLREHQSFGDFFAALPNSCPIVAVEIGGEDLVSFSHPERAIYLLGSEDHGIPPSILMRCHSVVSIPAIRTASFNVSVAGAIVMFDRMRKRGGAA